MFLVFVRVYVQKVNLWKIQRKNVKVGVPQDMLNPQRDFVWQDALEILKLLLKLLIENVFLGA